MHKKGFLWTDAATVAFTTLKEALSTAPVLHMPDFTKPFALDCNTSGTGFGRQAACHLQQTIRDTTFEGGGIQAQAHRIGACNASLASLFAGLSFRRPHRPYALKYMLDQLLSTVPQHQWISKVFGFDLNSVADALSRHDDARLLALSALTSHLYEELRQELQAVKSLR